MDTKSEDKQLIQDTLSGRTDAFGLLVRKHQGALLDVVVRVVGNRVEAEDVVQQVFIDAYRHLAEFRFGAQFYTWLYSIALNRARNHLRQRKTGGKSRWMARPQVPINEMFSNCPTLCRPLSRRWSVR